MLRSPCLGLALLGPWVGAWLCDRWACGLQTLDAPWPLGSGPLCASPQRRSWACLCPG